jgi:PAS domain S-box-containing protein
MHAAPGLAVRRASNVPRRASRRWREGRAAVRVLGSSTARRSLSDSVLVRAVLETSSEAFVGVGTDGAIEDWNTAAQRLFGLQRDQVIGRSIDRLVHKGCLSPPGEDGLAQVLLHPPSAEVRTTMRARARHASGREFPVLISLLRGAGPSGWSVRAFVRDPSERQAPEQDSPPEEARLERLPDALSPEEQLSEHGRRADDAARAAVMEIMAEGVLVVDHLGLLTAMNRAAGKLLGWSEDDWPGAASTRSPRTSGSPRPGAAGRRPSSTGCRSCARTARCCASAAPRRRCARGGCCAARW